jgi:alkylation response protein AidB-like acyl-CoA dehydrogenase
VDFDLGPKAEAFRLEVRDFLDEHLTPEMHERSWRTGTRHDWDLHRAMAERRWIAPAWPWAYGGQDRTEVEVVAMKEEFAYADAPTDGQSTTMLVVDTLRHVGTEDQKQAIIPRVLSGEILICLGYSEPDSGSDVAAAKTRAVRHGDEWVINGQKMFTTLAHESAYVFLLTRTDPDVPKHRGLTLFLVPMDTPGVEVSPIRTLGDQRTNVTFYTDVVVPDSARVGEVDGGWDVMTIGLALERTTVISPGPTLERVLSWVRTAVDDAGRPVLDHRPVRQQLARTAVDAEVSKLLCRWVAWAIDQGRVPSIEGSMAKLFGGEADNRDSAALLDVLGPLALLQGGQSAAVAAGELEHTFRHAPFHAIGGGATEIQRGIIAQRWLGLPRSR